MKSDLYYLKEAYTLASEVSTDPSTQNGAVLVNDKGHILAWGANHFPNGVKESEERWTRPAKYQWVEHAERNAIFHAAKRGVKTKGLIMYCPWFACADCGRAIIQAGIKHVVGHSTKLHETSPNWKDSIAVALKMFDESGVTYRYVEGEIDVDIRFNGKIVKV